MKEKNPTNLKGKDEFYEKKDFLTLFLYNMIGLILYIKKRIIHKYERR